ncbi:hypothetical protein EON62_03240 [archaeon]|nr:MAG: hypothetical protein EON62_03240 [archaeon]
MACRRLTRAAGCTHPRPAASVADVELEGEYISARMGGMDEATLASEEALLRRFMPEAPQARRTLADIIMEKMKEAEAMKEADAAAVEAEESGRPALDPKIVEVYSEVGRYLSHYKSGKLPKVFKVIPGLSNWEEILFLTNPETWTPHATYAATRIFASSFNAVKAQRFYNLILLPKCRDDVYFNKRMNFHLYMALKKATYKPAGFYKGIILPLVASGDCTLREAIIFSSVVAKVSIPQMHSAAALMKIASAPYTGATSVFLKVCASECESVCARARTRAGALARYTHLWRAPVLGEALCRCS